MKKYFVITITALLISMCLIANTASARDVGKKERFGAGLQFSYPAWGISGMYDVTDNVSVQAILGVVGDLKTYAGRGIYRFKKAPFWNAYGYGMIGAWNYTQTIWEWGWFRREITETVMGFGAGGGIEYDWRAWDRGLPPIFWNLEVGLGSVRFERVGYDFATFMVGVGAHYRF